MEFVIDSNQNFYFDKNGYIEFVDFFSNKEFELLSKCIVSVLKNRLYVPDASSYLNGRDLWRDSKDLKRVLLKSGIGKVTSQLIHQKSLRLAADQWIHGGTAVPLKETLAKSFPFQGTELGIMVAVDNSTLYSIESPIDSPIFPKTSGHTVFFKGDLAFDFAPFASAPAICSYYLIVVTQAKAVYMLQENDPCTHSLKQLGYGFGDKLSDVDHPYLIR